MMLPICSRIGFASIGVCLLLAGNGAQVTPWHTPPNLWKEPRNFQTPFEKPYDSYLSISRQPMPKELGSSKLFSPNKAYWLAVQGFTPEKPILIFNERDYLTRIAPIRNDPDYHVKRSDWINEKLIYIEVWWGRVLGSCFIFDVEKQSFLYSEMVHDGNLPYQQWQQKK